MSNAYLSGWAAREAGIPRIENPHLRGTPEYVSWLRGYEACKLQQHRNASNRG